MRERPFEYADGRLRDVTHATAKKLIRLALRVARGALDRLVVEEARRVVGELEEKRTARRRAYKREWDVLRKSKEAA